MASLPKVLQDATVNVCYFLGHFLFLHGLGM
jgi:hypothetical protein